MHKKEEAPIILSKYNPEWPLKYEEEKIFLMDIIGKWLHGNIEHIGSTSIPGLTAKPVIDIMFGVKSLEDSKAAIEFSSRIVILGRNRVETNRLPVTSSKCNKSSCCC